MSKFGVCGKTTPYGKTLKIVFRKFTWRHRLTLLCLNVVKFVRRKIGEIMRYLLDQKIGCLSNCHYHRRNFRRTGGSDLPLLWSRTGTTVPHRNFVWSPTFQIKVTQLVTTTRIAPKICQDQFPTFDLHCSRLHQNRFTFGRVITEVNRTREDRRVFI